MNSDVLIEVTIFKTKAEVDQAQFLAADAAFTYALKAMGGFIKRDLLQGENDVWIDIIEFVKCFVSKVQKFALINH